MFHSHSYGLKWPWVNFLSFWGSNSTQILIFEVKYLRDPTMTPQHERRTPHLTHQHEGEPPPREAAPLTTWGTKVCGLVLVCGLWCMVCDVMRCMVWCSVWCVACGLVWCVVWFGVWCGVVWCVVWCVVCGVVWSSVWCGVWCGHLNYNIYIIIQSSNYVQNAFWQSGSDSRWFLSTKKLKKP